MFLDFAAAFVGEDDTSKDLALIALETIVTDSFQLERRIGFLDSITEHVSVELLLPWFQGDGLYANYYRNRCKLEPEKVRLLDSLSRSPTALRGLHERIRPTAQAVPMAKAVSPEIEADGAASVGKVWLAGLVAAAALVIAVLLTKQTVDASRRAEAAEQSLAQAKADAQRELAQAEARIAERDQAIASLASRGTPTLAQQTELHVQPGASSDGKRVPYIDLTFGDVSPETISKIDLCKDYAGEKSDKFETLYYWRSRRLPPSVRVEYRHEPDAPPRPLRTLIRFYLTSGGTVDKSLDLDSSSKGIAFRGLPQGVDLIAKADTTADGEVNLSLGVGGTLPRSDVDQATRLMVVIRPVNGTGPWGGKEDAQYAITDTGLTLADLGKSPQRSAKVDLKRLGIPERPEETPPSDYDLLFVALPAAPFRSQISAAEFSAYNNRVVKRVPVHWDRRLSTDAS
jgi:hypothetical protein